MMENQDYLDRRKRRTLAGFIGILATATSTFVMPFAIVDYYESKRKYLIENPSEINHYDKTAEENARYNAAMLGSFWGTANIFIGMGSFAYGLINDKDQNKEGK